jgi:hypothetical protein
MQISLSSPSLVFTRSTPPPPPFFRPSYTTPPSPGDTGDAWENAVSKRSARQTASSSVTSAETPQILSLLDLLGL